MLLLASAQVSRSLCMPLSRYAAWSLRRQSRQISTQFGKRTVWRVGFCASAAVATVYATIKLSAPLQFKAEVTRPKTIRLRDIGRHGPNSESIWVYRGTKVYDITDWVSVHPGGEIILRAAGGSIDQYWAIFNIHQKQDVYDILDQYFIGDIDPQDLVNGAVPQSEVLNPFKDDPQRDSRLITHTERPRNAETPPEGLTSYLTPAELFYVRNHLWVPADDESTHTLEVELQDGETKSYTVADLKAKFPSHVITATLQCSGNRRSHMSQNSRLANGIPWGVGAIGTAEWKGVRLRDVLADVGFPVVEIPDDAKHVHLIGSESYGASIPILKAVDPYGDVLLAYEMNGKPLPRDHGYPIRAIIPGHVAARSVKWLRQISISDDESPSQWQRKDYKCFGPNQGSDVDWDTAPSIQETPVQSVITKCFEIPLHCKDGDQETLRAWSLNEDSICVEGYAFAGGGRAIARVDISVDGGHTWNQASLLDDKSHGNRAWAWSRWKFACPKVDVANRIVVKAVDESYNTQPDSYPPTFNFRGNLTQSWHSVPLAAALGHREDGQDAQATKET